VTAEPTSVVRRSLPVGVRVGSFLVAGVVAAALGAVFQRVGAARVDIDDLGAFNAILAVVGGTGLLGLGLQVVVVRQRLAVAAIARVGALVTVVVVAAGVAAVPGPIWYRVAVAMLLGAVVAATFGGLVPRSRLLWRSSWMGVGTVYIVGALARLAVLVPLLALIDTQVVAAVAATLVAEVAMLVAAVALNRRAARRGDPSHLAGASSAGALPAGVVPAVVALGGLWLLTIVDTLLARLRLDAGEADSYALASTVARASFFLALLIAHLALPTFMRERGRSPRLRRAFNITTAMIIAVAVTVSVAIMIWPAGTAQLVLGDEAAIVDLGVLRLLAAGWACLSLVPLLTFFSLDRHPRLAAVPLLAAATVGVVGLFVESAAAVAVTMMIAAAASVAVMGVPSLQRLSPVTRAVPWAGAVPSPAAAEASLAEHDGLIVVVPFYNPGAATVIDTVSRLSAALRTTQRSFRILAVSDGSTDGSAAALEAAAVDGVTVVAMPTNRGKGAALRMGFSTATAPLVGFIDADGDLPPEQIVQLLDIAEATGADAVVGSKLHPSSALSMQQHRRMMSSAFRLLVRVLFRLDVRDTQTGIKIYRGAMITPLTPMLAENGFAIDVEILVAARRSGALSIVEAPVTLTRVDAAATTVSARGAIATLGGLTRIFWRDRVAMRYDRDQPSLPVASANPAAGDVRSSASA
jgi:hypothetical protein